MRFQIDTTNHTIQVLDQCRLGMLVIQLAEVLPNWRSYKLVKNIGVEFDAPIFLPHLKGAETTLGEIIPTNCKEPLINFSSEEYRGVYNIEIIE